MRVIEIREHGEPDVLVPASRPDPTVPVVGSGEILIRVLAAGINRPDVLQRKGHYPVPPGASDIPGLEVAGEIMGGDLSHSDNAFGLKVGDKVCALVQGGGYADLCIAPVAQCLLIQKALVIFKQHPCQKPSLRFGVMFFNGAH
jgi:NADPH2:quinone reductase